MSKQIKIAFAVTAVSALCGVILALADKNTRDAIAMAERRDFLTGLAEVLPSYDNSPDASVVSIKGEEVYVAEKNGRPAGYAVRFSSGKGYGGMIDVLVGVDTEGRVSGVAVLKHKETPGLGDKIAGKVFLSSFEGLAEPDEIKVKKDGGVIDQFSGATMSPRAVAEAVSGALKFLHENIFNGNRP